MKSIRYAVIEDQSLLAGFIARSIEENLGGEIRTYSRYQDAFEGLQRFKPNIVLLDINLGQADGLNLHQQLSPLLPDTRWIVCTAYSTSAIMHRVALAGVHGVILKTADEAELLAAIKAIAEGKPYVSATAKKVMSGSGSPMITADDSKLLNLLSNGLSAKEIVSVTGGSERTVRERIQKLRLKLGSATNAEMVKRAVELGIVKG